MTDAPLPTEPQALAQAAEDAADTVPPRVPGLLRKGVLIALLILIVVLMVAVPLLAEPIIVSRLRQSLAAHNLYLDGDISLSLIGARLSGTQLKLREGTFTDPIVQADELTIDLGVIGSITGDGILIERLAATGVTGTFRRRADGRPPMAPETDEDGKPIDWKSMDWVGMYEKYGKRAYEWWKERETKQEEAKRNPPPPKPGEDPDWKEAKRWDPQAPAADKPWPRVIVKELAISGRQFDLPDQGGFDITGFELSGSDLTNRLNTGEQLHVSGNLRTSSAGAFELAAHQLASGVGGLSLKAPTFPIAMLADSKLFANDRIQKYQPTGTAAFELSLPWDGIALGSTAGVIAAVSHLGFTPHGSVEQQVLTLLQKQGDKPITWPVRLSGQVYAPGIADAGFDDVLKSLSGAAVDAAIDAGTARLQQEASKQLGKVGEKYLGDKGGALGSSAGSTAAGAVGSGAGKAIKGLLGK